MGPLGSMVGQLYAGTLLVDVCVALMLFIYLSILYKGNPAFTVVENIAVGAITAVKIVGAVGSMRTQLFPPLLLGQAIYMVPVFFGLLYFSVFGRGIWRTVFRSVLILSIARDLAFNFRSRLAWVRMVVWSYARITTIGRLAAFVLMIVGMTYFLFGARLERPTRTLRSVGVYAVYAMVPAAIVTFLTMFMYEFIGMMSYTVKSPAVIIPIALAVWIAIDVLRRR